MVESNEEGQKPLILLFLLILMQMLCVRVRRIRADTRSCIVIHSIMRRFIEIFNINLILWYFWMSLFIVRFTESALQDVQKYPWTRIGVKGHVVKYMLLFVINKEIII